MGRHSELNSSARIVKVNKFYKNVLIEQDDLTLKENISFKKYHYEKDMDVFTFNFPMIIQSSGEVWEIATVYLMYCLEEIRDLDGEILYNFALYTTNFTEPLSYQDSAFLKLPKFP